MDLHLIILASIGLPSMVILGSLSGRYGRSPDEPFADDFLASVLLCLIIFVAIIPGFTGWTVAEKISFWFGPIVGIFVGLAYLAFNTLVFVLADAFMRSRRRTYYA